MPIGNKNNSGFLTIGLLAIFATGAHAQVNAASAELEARLTSIEKRVQSVMKANFNLMRTNSRQEKQIEQLRQQVAQLHASNISGLNNFVSVGVDQHGRPAVFFDAVNVYVRDGQGSNSISTDSGLGNIILGYNEAAGSDAEPYCTGSWSYTTNYYISTEADCLAEGYEWTNNNKTGRHNLIIGTGHNYSGDSNIVIGFENSVADEFNIISGYSNYAGGASVILGAVGSKGFFQASILSSNNGLVSQGSMLSSYSSSLTGGGSYNGSVISSIGHNVELDGSNPTVHIANEPYISN